jgi:hypothetical protein
MEAHPFTQAQSLIMTNEIYGYSLWQHGAHDFAADA